MKKAGLPRGFVPFFLSAAVFAAALGLTLWLRGVTASAANVIPSLPQVTVSLSGDAGPKGVRTQVQGDELRVFGKKRDDLQAVQALAQPFDPPVCGDDDGQRVGGSVT